MKQQHQSCNIRQAAHKLKYRRPVEAGPKKLQSIKSWDTFAFLGCFPIHTGPTPPSPTNNVGRAYPECFFSEFQRCIGGGGRTAREFRKGCTVLRGNPEMTKKYEYYITAPRTFLHDCSFR